MKAFKVIIISGFSISCLFSIFTLIFSFGDWHRLFAVSIFGLFIGFLAAPEFEPKAFKQPFLWQTICGLLSGLTIAVYFNLENPFFTISLVVGALLGGTATLWIKHIQIP